MFPITTCSGWCCLVVVQVSADIVLLGLILPCYGASVGWMSFVWHARLDIDLYGIGSRDRTTWETSFRPHSLAEISVAEPGSFELQFGKTVVFSLLLSICSYFVDSWKLSFPYSRIPETETSTARHPPCQQMPPKNADKSANYRFATLVTVGIPKVIPSCYLLARVLFAAAQREDRLLFVMKRSYGVAIFNPHHCIVSALTPREVVFSGDAMCKHFFSVL